MLTLSNLIAGFHSRGVQTDQSLKVVKTSHFKLYQCVFFCGDPFNILYQVSICEEDSAASQLIATATATFTSSSNLIRSREPPTSYSAAANGSASSEVTVKLMEKMLRKKAVARLVMKVKDQEETTTIVVAHLQIEINGFLCF